MSASQGLSYSNASSGWQIPHPFSSEEPEWSSNDELENDPQNPLLSQVMNLITDTEEVSVAPLLSPVRKGTDSGCPSSEIMSPETNIGNHPGYNVKPINFVLSPKLKIQQFVGSHCPLGLTNQYIEPAISTRLQQNRKTPAFSEWRPNLQSPPPVPPMVCNYPPPQIPSNWLHPRNRLDSACAETSYGNLRPITSGPKNTNLFEVQGQSNQKSTLMLLNQDLKNMNIASCQAKNVSSNRIDKAAKTSTPFIPQHMEFSLRLDQQIEAAKDIRYKTQMCIHYQRYGECPRVARCRFAHGTSELRLASSHPKYRTLHCIHFIRSGGRHCPFGDECFFIHSLSSTQNLGVNPIVQHPAVIAHRAKLTPPTPIQ